MDTNFIIKTSFVSPLVLEETIKHNYLPIFIIRNISYSTLIGKYSNSPIHFKSLSPSTELFKLRKEGLNITEYLKRYIIEIMEIDLQKELERMENLARMSNARGVIIFGYGSNYSECHRSVLSDLINSSNLVTTPVREIII